MNSFYSGYGYSNSFHQMLVSEIFYILLSGGSFSDMHSEYNQLKTWEDPSADICPSLCVSPLKDTLTCKF